MKKTAIWGKGLVCLLSAVALVACGTKETSSSNHTTNASQPSKTNQQHDPSSANSQAGSRMTEQEVNQLYAPLVAAYEKALEAGKVTDPSLNSNAQEVLIYGDTTYDGLVYNTLDIDGDGVKELVIALLLKDHGLSLLDLYTAKDGQAIRLTSPEVGLDTIGVRTRVEILSDGRLRVYGSGGATLGSYYWYERKSNEASYRKVREVKVESGQYTDESTQQIMDQATFEANYLQDSTFDLGSQLGWHDISEYSLLENGPLSSDQETMVDVVLRQDTSLFKGSWQNAKGERIRIQADGTILYPDTNTSATLENLTLGGKGDISGSVSYGLTGAGFGYYPPGVAATSVTDATDESKERIAIAQAPITNDNVYYRVD